MAGSTDWPAWCRSSGTQGERAAITRETTRVTATVGRRWLCELEALPPSPGRWPGTRYAVRHLAKRLAAHTDPASAAEWAFWDTAGETMDAIARATIGAHSRWAWLLMEVRRVVETAERDLAAEAHR